MNQELYFIGVRRNQLTGKTVKMIESLINLTYNIHCHAIGATLTEETFTLFTYTVRPLSINTQVISQQPVTPFINGVVSKLNYSWS